MTKSVRLAGVALVCASLLLTGCAKSKESSTSTSSGTTTTTTDTTPAAAAADATSAPATDATSAAASSTSTTAPVAVTATTTASTSGDGAKNAFIAIPVYPGASELKDQGMAMSSNGTSVVMKIYATPDDTKRVIEWYKAHLPAAWKNFEMSSGGKTSGTFSSEGTDGDQSLIISTQDDKTTRIQAATKHGK